MFSPSVIKNTREPHCPPVVSCTGVYVYICRSGHGNSAETVYMPRGGHGEECGLEKKIISIAGIRIKSTFQPGGTHHLIASKRHWRREQKGHSEFSHHKFL